MVPGVQISMSGIFWEGGSACISGSPLRMGDLPFIWAVCSLLSEQIALWSQVCFQDLGIPKDVMILSLHKGVNVEDEDNAVCMFIWLGYMTNLYIIYTVAYVYTHAVHHAAHSFHSKIRTLVNNQCFPLEDMMPMIMTLS